MRHTVLVLVCVLAVVLGLPSSARAATVAQTWGVGTEPFGVTIDPRDGKVYVANSDHNAWNMPTGMTVVDPSVGVSSFTLPAPQVMSAIDTSLDRLFVTLTNGLGIVDLPTRSLIMNVPVGSAAGMAYDPVTHDAYVATISGLSMVDGVSGAVLARRSSASSNDAWWHVAQDAALHRLYVSNGNFGGAPSVVVLDDRDLSLLGNVSLPAIPRLALAVDASRGLVYVGGFSSSAAPLGSVYAIDESTLQIVKTLDVSAGVASTFSFTLSPDASTLWVSDITQSAGSLVVVDAATFTVRDRTPLSFQPGQSALHPDGRLYVTAFNTRQLVALRITNSAPVIDSLSLSSASPRTNDTLTASVAAHDPDGDALTYTYEWLRNDVAIAGANGPSLDLSVAGNGDKGDTITARVTASDGQATTTSTASVTVANTPPTVSVSLNTTTPGKRDQVIATATGADADHDTLTYSYTWRLGGVVQTNATSSFDLRTVESEYGDVLSVTVITSDGTATATASASATVTRPKH